MHFFGVFLFSDAHFWTWAPTIIVSTRSSPHAKKHKGELCFLFVCKLCSYAFCLVYQVCLSLCLSLLLSCQSVYSMCFSVVCLFHLLWFYLHILLLVYCIFHLRSVSACHCNSLQPYKFDGNIHNVFTCLSADIVNLLLTFMCVYLFRGGVQPPVGRTSPQRMGWWWPCLPVRPAPGLSQPSWPATCWWPTSCWLTYS